jgi:uncharacterized membrane protein
MQTAQKNRNIWLDQTRGFALVAMTAYHLAWDLFSLGLTSINPVSTPILAWSAKIIAASFLGLSGIALTLAHPDQIDWIKVWQRSLRLFGSAGLVSLGSFYLFPDSWIAFGILHHMALAGLLGLLALRLSLPALLSLAGLCFVLPFFAKSIFFNHPLWGFLGLSTIVSPANDYVPLLPWFSFVLAGIIMARSWPKTVSPQHNLTRSQKFFGFLGRHSLIYYLVHQPVMLGILNIMLAYGILAPTEIIRSDFTKACVRDCSFDQGDEKLCHRLCDCLFENLQSTPDLLATTPERMTSEQEEKLRYAVRQCR